MIARQNKALALCLLITQSLIVAALPACRQSKAANQNTAQSAPVGLSETEAGEYITAKVERKTIEGSITASGYLQASGSVQVGTDVTGRIAWVGVKLNARVKRGQVIARINPTQLSQAQTNPSHTTITSPIDGVVISRNIEVGQYVGQSTGNAQVLLVIAKDPTRMEMRASIDETDAGQLRQGMKASVKVDAIPGETLDGEIKQLRLDSQPQQGGVTYSAVIELLNPELKLRPGMTAIAVIGIGRAENVLAIQLQAIVMREPTDDQANQTNSGAKNRKEVVGVFVIGDDNRAHFRQVETGIKGDQYIEVKEGGGTQIKETDEIITGPYRMLRTLKENDPVARRKV